MELIIGLLVLLVALYWYLRSKYDYWNKRGIKSMSAVPLLGTYGHFVYNMVNPCLRYEHIYNKYPDEKYVGGFKGDTPELVVRDPEVIRSIVNKDFSYFQDRPRNSSDTSLLLNNLFSLQGEAWVALRRKITPTFTSSKMRQMFPLIVECGEQLQMLIKDALLENNEQEVRELMAKFTTDTIGSCAFGLKMNSMSDETAIFRKIGRQILAPSKKRHTMQIMKIAIPKLLQLLGVTTTSVASMEGFFLNLTKQIIESRKTEPKRHDFMDLLIELKLKNEDESLVLTEELMAAQAFVFFFAGFETSATTMSYALFELARNPDKQEKLIIEIDEVLAKYEGNVTYDAIQNMKYLDMVINETLRKYPPVGNLNRLCLADYNLPESKIIINKDVEIIIPVYALQMDPKYFPGPQKFIPERFSVTPDTPITPYTYLPFGEGPRNCIGSRFGKLQTATGLISVLSKYSMKICKKTQKCIKYDPYTALTTSKDGIILKIESRC